jgi:hypothetical protein
MVRHGQEIKYDHNGPEISVQRQKAAEEHPDKPDQQCPEIFGRKCNSGSEKRVLTDNTATISVTDKGIGISEEDQEHLFFFFPGQKCTEYSGHRPGTAYCKTIHRINWRHYKFEK